MTQAERFRQAHADAPFVFGASYASQMARMRERLQAWMRRTGDDVVTAALAIEAREHWSHLKSLALAAAVEIMAEGAS